MTDYVDVVEHNPIVFVKAICEAIGQGYLVQNSNAGYPQFGLYGNTMRLFKGEPRGGVIISSEASGMVEHYDPMHFVMLLENYVLAGYTFKDGGKHYFDELGLKSIEMEIAAKAAPVEQKEVKKATAKKALKAEPTINEMEAYND